MLSSLIYSDLKPHAKSNKGTGFQECKCLLRTVSFAHHSMQVAMPGRDGRIDEEANGEADEKPDDGIAPA